MLERKLCSSLATQQPSNPATQPTTSQLSWCGLEYDDPHQRIWVSCTSNRPPHCPLQLAPDQRHVRHAVRNDKLSRSAGGLPAGTCVSMQHCCFDVVANRRRWPTLPEALLRCAVHIWHIWHNSCRAV